MKLMPSKRAISSCVDFLTTEGRSARRSTEDFGSRDTAVFRCVRRGWKNLTHGGTECTKEHGGFWFGDGAVYRCVRRGWKNKPQRPRRARRSTGNFGSREASVYLYIFLFVSVVKNLTTEKRRARRCTECFQFKRIPRCVSLCSPWLKKNKPQPPQRARRIITREQ